MCCADCVQQICTFAYTSYVSIFCHEQPHPLPPKKPTPNKQTNKNKANV